MISIKTVSIMDKWNNGPPPSIGWWPASMYRDKESIRWWNGHHWSESIGPGASAREAGICAALQADSGNIKWSHKWW